MSTSALPRGAVHRALAAHRSGFATRAREAWGAPPRVVRDVQAMGSPGRDGPRGDGRAHGPDRDVFILRRGRDGATSRGGQGGHLKRPPNWAPSRASVHPEGQSSVRPVSGNTIHLTPLATLAAEISKAVLGRRGDGGRGEGPARSEGPRAARPDGRAVRRALPSKRPYGLIAPLVRWNWPHRARCRPSRSPWTAKSLDALAERIEAR